MCVCVCVAACPTARARCGNNVKLEHIAHVTKAEREREIKLRQEQTRSQWRKAKTTPTTRALKTKQKKLLYHWRDLPQVSFLSRQNGLLCLVAISVLVATKVLSRQTRFLLFLRQKFYPNKNICSRQFCHDKSFVAASLLLSRQKTCFVATNTCLSRQK